MDAASLLRMISEPTRHAILEALRRQDATVTDLVEGTGREQSNLSHHLRTLKDAGLVRSRAVGRNRVYKLADPELRRLLDQVEQMANRLETVAYYSGLELPYDPGFHGYG